MISRLSGQRGATLLISLIMLMLITLFTITSFKLGKGNLQIVGNMQQRSQALVAAQGVIEQTISSTQFSSTPANALPYATVPTFCGINTSTTPNKTCVDVTGSGVAGVTVEVKPTCVLTQVIPNTALDLTSPQDVGCSLGANQNFGIAGANNNNNSLCADMLWDIQAVGTDAISNASSTINQGVALRQPATAQCP